MPEGSRFFLSCSQQVGIRQHRHICLSVCLSIDNKCMYLFIYLSIYFICIPSLCSKPWCLPRCWYWILLLSEFILLTQAASSEWMCIGQIQYNEVPPIRGMPWIPSMRPFHSHCSWKTGLFRVILNTDPFPSIFQHININPVYIIFFKWICQWAPM